MKKRRSILKQTILLGISTLISRVFGLAREILLIRFLGVGFIADAFNVAFMIPNAMRKIFAEGALTASVSPTLVSVKRHVGKNEMNKLVTLILFSIQAILLIFCLLVTRYSSHVVEFTAPGFSTHAIMQTSVLLSILIYFIIFISASSVLASALQAMNRFFVPANAQILLNFLLVCQLAACIVYGFSVTVLAWCMIFNGFIMLLSHLIAYYAAGLSLAIPDKTSLKYFWSVMGKFLPCIITVGSMELSLFIDRRMASFLPEGSISLLSYTSSFIRMPLGVFAVGFATIMLPTVSRVALYAPKRLAYYLLESMKFMAYVTIPTSFLMMAFSYKIFETVLLSKTFTLESVAIASKLLATFSFGLFFFSCNKIIANIFYALHDTFRPTVITLIGAVINTILNIILMRYLGILGIVIATTFSAAVQTVMYLIVLRNVHHIPWYGKRFFNFLKNASIQGLLFGLLLYGGYAMVRMIVRNSLWSSFLMQKFGYWLWVGPLCIAFGLLMYVTRKKFGIRIYFLDEQG